MRILMLTNAMDAGGAETHLLTLACGLAVRGHRVAVASAGGRMVESLTDGGVRHVRIPLDSRRPDRLIAARRALARLLDGERFDVVHAHARLPAFLVSSLALRRGLCFVTTAHADFSATPLRRRFSRWGYATVAVSEDIAHALSTCYGIDSSRVRVIRNGVDTDAFRPAARAPRRGFSLVCMSRLDRDCAEVARLLCRLAPRLAREIKGLSVTVLGGGDAMDEIQREAERVRDRCGVEIHLAGHVSDPRPFLAGCDGFVGVSRAALEAMACARCVILGGNEGFFGLLDAESAPVAALENFCARGRGEITEEKLFSEILRLARMSEAERSARGQALRDYVVREQSAKEMVAKTEGFYRCARENFSAHGGEILLCGYYGYGNLGDDALLRAAIARARKRFPGKGITALTRRGARDALCFGVPCIGRRSPIALWRALRHAECLVLGGGTLLQDATSRRSLWYYTGLLRIAQGHGVACELWANGIGTLTGRGSERRVREALLGCRFVGLRDGSSLALAENMMKNGACTPVREDDLALATPPADAARIAYLRARIGPISEKGAVLVAVKGGAARGSLCAMERWLCTLRGEGYTLLLASFYPREDDALTDALCTSLGGVRLRGVGASDLVGLLPDCSAVCAMRLHALVLASAVGTPFVGFGTDEKIASFCREHGGLYFVDLYGREGE